MGLDEMSDKVDHLEKRFENLSEATISKDRIRSIENNIGSLEDDLNHLNNKVESIEQNIKSIEKDMVRIDTEADQLPAKLQRLPDAEYLDDMITSVGKKMEDKIDTVSDQSISRRELYSYAALISFFVSLIIGMIMFALRFFA